MSGDTETVANEINIIETVQETINTLCNSLFDSIRNTIFPLLDEIVFIDNDIMESAYMEKLFGTSLTSGVLILANCLFTAFVLYYCIRLLISHLSGSNIESPREIFYKSRISFYSYELFSIYLYISHKHNL